MVFFNSILNFSTFIITFLLFLDKLSCFIPQIVDRIVTAVVEEKGTAYLNCSMWATWRGSNDVQISMGESIMKPVREGIYKLDKYQVRFIQGRPGYSPTLPGQSPFLRTYQLIIRFADAQDSKFTQRVDGTFQIQNGFRCSIEIPSQPRELWPSAYGQVIVKRLTYILPGLTSQIVNEGASLTLRCQTTDTPKPNISWSRANGQPFSLPNAPQRVLNETLFIPQVYQHDRGVYRCFAVNNVYHSTEYSVMVQVNYKPFIRRARVDGQYDANLNVILECVVNGYPDPDLYWYKGIYNSITNNIPIYNNDRYSQEKTFSYGAVGTNVTDVFSLLMIRNIREADYGNYSCRAENKYGSAFTIVNLFCICQGAICPMIASTDITGKVIQN